MEVQQRSGTRYAHTSIVAVDWKRLVSFYEEVFGCEPAGPERHNHGPQVEALTGIPGAAVRGRHLRLPGHGNDGPTLEIFQYERSAKPLKSKINRPGIAHLAFQVDDVSATRKQVLARGGAGYGELQTLEIPGVGTLTLIYMTDPEGNIVELQHWE